jgi:type I restriction enzyme S subunit
MASSRCEHLVSDLIADRRLVVGDGYRAKNSELSKTGLPFARAGNISIGFDFDECDYFPAHKLSNVGNKVSQSGDVVFTSKGTVGRFAFVRADTPAFVYSPQLCFWRSVDSSFLDARYLYFWMTSAEFAAQFKSVSGQTDMAEYVSLTDQRRMWLRVPPLPEQRAIAHILGTLDDKIDLNRQMSATLEAMARALFESWFVRFDPVRAKAEGRDTGLPAEIGDLFPDRFEESEIGEVPKGWRVDAIGTVAECVGGSTPSTKEPRYWDGGVHHWATPRDMSSLSCRVLTDTERTLTDAGVREITSGVLPVGAVLLSSRAPVGYLAVAAIPISINQGFIALKPSPSVPSSFLLGWCESQLEAIKNRASGTTFPEISKAAFRPMLCIVPNASVMSAFDAASRALTDRVITLVRQVRTLTALRDTLLPKLISGDLRVPDAERFLADAGV